MRAWQPLTLFRHLPLIVQSFPLLSSVAWSVLSGLLWINLLPSLVSTLLLDLLCPAREKPLDWIPRTIPGFLTMKTKIPILTLRPCGRSFWTQIKARPVLPRVSVTTSRGAPAPSSSLIPSIALRLVSKTSAYGQTWMGPGFLYGSRLSLFRSGGTASVRILTPRNSSAPSSLAGTSPLPSILNRLTQNGTCQLRTWHPTTSKPLFLDPFNDTWFGDKNVQSVRVNALVTAPRARKCGPPAPQLTIAKYQSLKIPPCPPTLKNLKGT